jgi:hypothetical protein
MNLGIVLNGPETDGLSPSSPAEFRPQHITDPSAIWPHVWKNPAVMDLNLFPPATGAGSVRLTWVLSPS